MYGQTGAGKTFTMDGITHMVLEQIYAKASAEDGKEYAVHISAVELYNEILRDLITTRDNLVVRAGANGGGMVVEGLVEKVSSGQADGTTACLSVVACCYPCYLHASDLLQQQSTNSCIGCIKCGCMGLQMCCASSLVYCFITFTTSRLRGLPSLATDSCIQTSSSASPNLTVFFPGLQQSAGDVGSDSSSQSQPYGWGN